jgi:hypothetical protein
MVPDPDLLSFMFARKEALLSAQIEGTKPHSVVFSVTKQILIQMIILNIFGRL